MTEEDRRAATASARHPEGVDPAEVDRLTTAIDQRFAPHLEAAAATVRSAERRLEEAREQSAYAERMAEQARYLSDPLVFMRQTVREEVESLERKTTAKKARAGYKFLLERAVDLAQSEVQGYQDDQERLQRELTEGVQACAAAVQRAESALVEARAMHQRVLDAEHSAREGLQTLLTTLAEDDS